jgi:hypothetical protein
MEIENLFNLKGKVAIVELNPLQADSLIFFK